MPRSHLLLATEAPRTDRSDGARRRRAVFGATWLLASLLGILWALATPVGASPDEPAHLVKAASVARGQLIGEPSSHGHIVQVPKYVAATHNVVCIVFQPNVSADCIESTPDDPSALFDTTTTAGLYNPLYYFIVGWPSLLFGDVSGIYAMRIVSAIATTLFLAIAVRFALEVGRRPALVLAAVGIAATPTLLFLTGAVNPNALEVTATLATFTGMLAIVQRTRTHGALTGSLTGPLIATAVSAAVGAQMRGLSPLWIAVALATPLILLRWTELRGLLTRRSVWVMIIAVMAAAAAAALWTVGSSSLTSSLGDEAHFQQYPGVGTSPFAGFAVMLIDTFNYGTQMIASFGWLDTTAPQAVYFVWSALIGALTLLAVAVLRGRHLVFAVALTLALLLLPPLAQAAYVTEGGYIWQGRYTLPLFVIAVVGIAVVITERVAKATETLEPARLTGTLRPVFAVVWLGWGLSQVYCFAVALRRNAVGDDGTWASLVRAPEWSAPGSNALLLAGFALVAAATAFVAWWITTRRTRIQPAG